MKATSNRWLYAAGAAVAVTAITVGGALAANAGEREAGFAAGAPALSLPAASASATSASAAPASASAAPASAAPDRSEPEDHRPVGDVIDTGHGDWVIYGFPLAMKDLPDTTFGFMLGRRLPDGTLEDVVATNETEGADKAAGFHAGSGAMNVDGRDTLTFGYYAGPATRITAKSGGRTVTAGIAAWSANPGIKVFWFAPSVKNIKATTAYDATGARLPGRAEYAVG